MEKHKKIVPKNFGKVLSILIGWVIGKGYDKEVVNILAELTENNGLLKWLTYKEGAKKKNAINYWGLQILSFALG